MVDGRHVLRLPAKDQPQQGQMPQAAVEEQIGHRAQRQVRQAYSVARPVSTPPATSVTTTWVTKIVIA